MTILLQIVYKKYFLLDEICQQIDLIDYFHLLRSIMHSWNEKKNWNPIEIVLRIYDHHDAQIFFSLRWRARVRSHYSRPKISKHCF